MKAIQEKTIIVNMILDEGEAMWLKGIMQNPFWSSNPGNENPIDKDMRERFWNILDDAGVCNA